MTTGKTFTPPDREVPYGKPEDLTPTQATTARLNQHLPTNEQRGFPVGTTIDGFDSVYSVGTNLSLDGQPVNSIINVGLSVGTMVVPWTPFGAVIDGNSGFGGSTADRVFLPNSIVGIDDGAFYGLVQCEQINFPDSLEYIGDNSFYYMNSPAFTQVNLPDRCSRIGENAFISCFNLAELNLNKVTLIEQSAFSACTGVTSVDLGSELIEIGANAFFGSLLLPAIDFPESLESIGIQAFANCAALSTILFRGMTAPTIGADIFLGVAATEVHVPVGASGYGSIFGGLTVVYDL